MDEPVPKDVEEKVVAVQTEKLSPETHFFQPEKLIVEAHDMPAFRKSIAYAKLVGYISALDSAAKNQKTIPKEYSERVERIMNCLSKINGIIDETPRVPGSHRFGNPAFRTFHSKINDQIRTILLDIVTEKWSSAIVELTDYLEGSFGNPQRMDFGTGHELSFVGFLKALEMLSVLEESDRTAIALTVMNRYFEVCRKLIMTYRLEPAGSHGVWGLDDHFFLPFILGSSQLADSRRPKPTNVLKPEVVDDYASINLYFGAVQFINRVKKGPFFEHSPILYDITAVPSWSKINQGLLKMYDNEVLGKYPVVQHFHFGALFSFQPVTTVKLPQPNH
ncbi:protein phosphatase type 2A [Schizosaccharomyces japonicus yFS275]|uniref:Serine/threonine-protein phosphatase 2A activator n=1 Tax=Schizosaccharomyces japonicus (strain yFS275 / FY16936) TaxID=402676 RepID=B6K078_SCHJY|nr:protein phosphatase type 2A [Schizosaccharomyces japonicus yFS275]EEB06228.1 protein phosphatase type 2A [Schizosaccharomyces japonicus yFS275]